VIKFMFDKKGSAEIVAFILVLPIILFPVFNTFHKYMEIHKYDILKQTAREALLRMEVTGGLTPEDKDKILDYLEDQDFERSKIHLDYTPHPVGFGEEVAVRITYDYTRVSYTFGIGGIQKVEENTSMVYGPLKSTSKYYEN